MSEVYIDGVFYPKEEAKVSVFDNGFLYGDGVFEGIRAYNGRIFRLKEHIDRLYDSAKAIWLDIPVAKEEMMEICAKTCARNGLNDAYIRLIVTRGKGNMGLDPHFCKDPTIVCITTQISIYPQEILENGLKLMTAATRRNYGEVLPPQVKSLNYLPNIMALFEATNGGAHEAVFMSREGYVTECSGDNLFLVKDGVLKTPPSGVGILRGVTRQAILEIARKLEIPTEEPLMNRWDLYTADEMFVAGTAAEVVAVQQIDGRPVGTGKPGPITLAIQKVFREMVGSEGYPIHA